MKKSEKIKKWIIKNPDKLLFGLTMLTGIGTFAVWHKLNIIEKCCNKSHNDEFLKGAHTCACDVHDIVIEKFGKEEGMKILNIIADEFDKRVN